MDYIISPADRTLFKRCRRAWDLGARTRQNYEPSGQAPDVDLARAVHDALDLYYFPGMWDWPAAVVLPLVRQAFRRSMSRQRPSLPPDRERHWAETLEFGECLLGSYFSWAPTVDAFAPIMVSTDLDVQVSDPDCPDRGLVTEASDAVRYWTRVDLLAIDEENTYWVVEHRLVQDEWAELDELLLDERGLSWCWALQAFYPGLRVAGTIYNELRLDAPHGAPARDPVGRRGLVAQHEHTYDPPIGKSEHRPVSGPRVRQEGTQAFRRSRIRRSVSEVASFGERVAREAQEMTSSSLLLYPNPSSDNCMVCAYRPPCIAINQGADVDAVLSASYRHRPPERAEQGRLGGNTWGLGTGALRF
jgi:hypothetical protein